jgi:hypothetical protein
MAMMWDAKGCVFLTGAALLLCLAVYGVWKLVEALL